MVATKDVHFCSELGKTAGVIGDKPKLLCTEGSGHRRIANLSPSSDLDPKLVPGAANAGPPVISSFNRALIRIGGTAKFESF